MRRVAGSYDCIDTRCSLEAKTYWQSLRDSNYQLVVPPLFHTLKPYLHAQTADISRDIDC